ncbi:hypothetical protein AB0M12_41945 [Nocardia vinacea]|uniref:hypothetical protein n=1 Tax=Nocardia vinacea TaxID=96468 RepID=UPI003426C1A1
MQQPIIHAITHFHDPERLLPQPRQGDTSPLRGSESVIPSQLRTEIVSGPARRDQMLARHEFGAITRTAGRSIRWRVRLFDDAEDGGEIHALGSMHGADLDHVMPGAIVFLERERRQTSPIQHLQTMSSIVTAVDDNCDVRGTGGHEPGFCDRGDEFGADNRLVLSEESLAAAASACRDFIEKLDLAVQART